MNKEAFFKYIDEIKSLGYMLNEEQKEKLYEYMNLLIEWNDKINLTAITDEEEIITKHFIDSLTILKYMDAGESVVDIGTGAGFPGIPLKIVNPKLKLTLVDSLNKRIVFLEEVIKQTNLKDIQAIHTRAEEFGASKEFREIYDVAVSRAVAKLNVLVEYMLPLIKVGGKCICMKGPNVEGEIEEAETAIKVLGGTIKNVEKFCLPNTNIERTIVVIKKTKNTNDKYPRKAGTPAKDPIK